ncbi:MAG: histidine phosphatase family protein [Alphaproteobacteria bacterium]
MTEISLFFFRHGETDYNARKIIQGQSDRSSLPGIADLGLNARGLHQAGTLADFLQAQGIAFDVVLSSDLKRGAETGGIVANAYGADLIAFPELREMFFGAENEGRTVEEFKKTIFDPPLNFADTLTGETISVSDGKTLRDLHKSTDPRHDAVAHPGGENKIEVRERGLAIIEKFVAANPGARKIGITSHNGFLRFLMPELDKVEHTECVQVIYRRDPATLEIVKRMKNPHAA